MNAIELNARAAAESGIPLTDQPFTLEVSRSLYKCKVMSGCEEGGGGGAAGGERISLFICQKLEAFDLVTEGGTGGGGEEGRGRASDA